MSGPVSFLLPEDQGKKFFQNNSQPAESVTPASVVAQMPNADKLTPVEHWIYGKLPGFSESTVGQALQKFSTSPIGKTLSYLDVFVEGVERSVGTIAQFTTQSPDEKFELADAWYAGALTADMMNLPVLTYDEKGTPNGVRIPTDLPWTVGLADARKKIAAYVSQGMERGQALIRVREEYYNSLGALALRAQLYDTYFHVLADPLNYLLPALKPVEALQARRFAAMEKISYSAEELTKMVSEAEKLGDVERAAKLTEAMTQVLKGKGLNTWDKFAIFMTGGDIFNPSKLSQKIAKIPILNAFQLTPESKAQELMTLMCDNISTKIIAPLFNDANAEAEFMKTIQRASAGAVGLENGHAFLTLEGRTAQAFIKGADEKVLEIFTPYMKLAEDRGLLKIIANAIGDTETKVLENARKNPQALFRLIQAAAPKSPELATYLNIQKITADYVGALPEMFKKLPYNKETFFAYAMAGIEDHAMHQAILQFGVKSRGLITRWSNAIKSAESLAFMRLNPAYAVRNAVNNDITMIARGAFGMMTSGEIETYWDDFEKVMGYLPRRLKEGFHAGSELETASSSVLQDALKGGHYGAPEKMQNFFQGIKLGGADMSALSRRAESKASMRAFTSGWFQYMNQFQNPTRAVDFLDAAAVDAVRQINPDLPELLDNVVKSARGMDAKLDELLKSNLKLNVESIVDAAGPGVRESLDHEILAYLHEKLPEAVRTGTLDEFSLSMRATLEKHLEDMFDKNVGDLVENIKSQVAAGGPQVFYDKFAEAQDVFWQAHTEHALKINDATQAAREASDLSTANSLWTKVMADDEAFYGRAFRRVDAILDGLEQGAKEAKIPFPAEVRQAFKQFQGEWQKFYEFRNGEYRKFFGAKLQGEEYVKGWDQLQSELDQMYVEAIAREDMLQMKVDDAVAAMIDDPQMQTIFKTYRDHMAELRKADKEMVVRLKQVTPDLPAEERQALYNQFWQERHQRYLNMHATDRAGIAAMQGDANAAQMLVAAPAPTTPQGQFDIYALANQYGIPSATQKGTRNNQRILNIVNAYTGGPTEAPIKKLEEMTTIPLSTLPEPISERFAQEAKRLMSELYGGEPGKRTAEATFGTTNVSWYRKLSEKGLTKPAIDKALNKIVEDAGKDKGVNVERMKDFILDMFKYGDPDSGTPPDLYVLNELGATKATMNDALADFNEITRQRFTLQEAIDACTPSEVIPHDITSPYYTPEGKLINPKRFMNVEEIPEETARTAFEARAARRGTQTPAKVPNQQFIAEYKRIVKDLQPLDLQMDQTMQRQYSALDKVIEAARKTPKGKPTLLSDLPDELNSKVVNFINHAKDEQSSIRLAATRFAEYRRDASLLNYNRRINFDSWIVNGFPYVFWTTGSVMKWAIESIDRPAMLTSFLRLKKFLETAGAPQPGLPSRLQDNIRIQLPFVPDWMGQMFVDPLRLLLPFDAFLQPIEQMQQTQMTANGRAERLLQTDLQDKQITQEEYDQAMTHQGPVWNMAISQVMQNDDTMKFDAWDFASLVSSPHAPLQWAIQAAQGHPENIGPFTPLSRIMKNAATVLGVPDWNNSPWNLEGKVRKLLGLPAYDKWDSYRTDRMLSNMIAKGTSNPDDTLQAMILNDDLTGGKITLDQAKQSPYYNLYLEATQKANLEYAGGISGFAASFLGLPIKAYPAGENLQRQLQDDFSNAYNRYKSANDALEQFIQTHPDMTQNEVLAAFEKANPSAAKDAGALTEFFDQYPQYEARLGLFDTPQERLQKILIDQAWSSWNSLPKVTKNELQDQLGQNFQDAFLNKTTRSYDSITSEELQVWIKLMGGKPAGQMTADQKMLADLFSGQMGLTKPETAWRVQVFFDTRDKYFPNYYEEQNAYYAPGANKSQVLAKYPDLKRYWDWRRDFMTDNPDLVPYLTDDPKAIEKAKGAKRTQQAIPTAQEIPISAAMQYLLQDYFQNGEELPFEATHYLEVIGQQYGMTGDEVLNVLGGRMQGTVQP